MLDWARAAGHRSGDNPVELIGDALPRHKREQQHHAALAYREVPQFIGKLRAGTSEPITKLAFEFLILTAARTTEVRKARWDEVDLADAPVDDPRPPHEGRPSTCHSPFERCLDNSCASKAIEHG